MADIHLFRRWPGLPISATNVDPKASVSRGMKLRRQFWEDRAAQKCQAAIRFVDSAPRLSNDGLCGERVAAV